MNRSERLAAVTQFLKADSTSSDRDVARRLGVAPATVGRVRRGLEANGVIIRSKSRIGGDGRLHPATSSSAAARQLGELPEAGLGEVIGDAATALFGTKERRQQRRIAGYLKRLAVPLGDLGELDGWSEPEKVADACVAVVGRSRADDLASTLGYYSHRIYRIAVAIRKQVANGPPA